MTGSRPTTKDSDKKQVHFKFSEACEGMEQNTLEGRGNEGRCKHCGYEGHDWKFCLHKNPVKKGIKNSPETAKKAKKEWQERKAAGTKRKADNDDSPQPQKKPAVLSVQQGRKMEVDSKDEPMDF